MVSGGGGPDQGLIDAQKRQLDRESARADDLEKKEEARKRVRGSKRGRGLLQYVADGAASTLGGAST